jgi:hypothetical protein
LSRHNLAEICAADQSNRGVIHGFPTYDCRIFEISCIMDSSSETGKSIEVMSLKIVLNIDTVNDCFGRKFSAGKE